jgi:hypothetical protein
MLALVIVHEFCHVFIRSYVPKSPKKLKMCDAGFLVERDLLEELYLKTCGIHFYADFQEGKSWFSSGTKLTRIVLWNGSHYKPLELKQGCIVKKNSDLQVKKMWRALQRVNSMI